MPRYNLSLDWLENEAKALIEAYELRFGAIDAPPVPFELIAERYLGLTCHICNLNTELGIDGLAAIAPKKGVIFIDEGCIGTPAYSFTLCHEIAHYRLHRQQRLFLSSQKSLDSSQGRNHWHLRERIPKLERQADRFAAAFLMPQRLLAPRASRHALDDPQTVRGEVYRLARLFDVSLTAMTYRLHALGLLSSSGVQKVLTKGSTSAYTP
jgi:Zn-dependent peptidase ImmA (M78 family)